MVSDTRNSGAFTLAGGAKFAGVSIPKMAELVHREDFPAFRVGRRWVIPRDALIRWMNERAAVRAQL